MSFFISDAWAQAGQAAPGGDANPLGMLIWLALFAALFYFMIIRPGQKRAKEHKKMVDSLSKGDEVITQGGMLGKIAEIGDNFVEIEASDNVRIKVQRQAIASVMPKGTIKNSL
jgi:preprotein translocase subunit YajC